MIRLDESVFNSESNITSLDTSITETFFEDQLQNELEFNEESRVAFREFYEALNEKADLKEVNTKFKRTMRTAMNAYLNKSSNAVTRFCMAFEKKINQDNEVIKPKLKKLDSYLYEKMDFEILYKSEDIRYEYSYLFEDYIPNPKYMDTFIYPNIDLKMIEAGRGLSDYDKLVMVEDEYNKLIDYIKSGNCYSKARGFIIQKSSEEISAEEFGKRLFDVFRSGGEELLSQVTVKDVKQARIRFTDYKKALDHVKDDFVIPSPKNYKKILEQIDALDMIYARKYFGNAEKSFEKWYSMYIALKYQQLLTLVAIHQKTLNAKMEAIMHSYIQDRNTILTVMGASTAEVSESFDVDSYAMFLLEEQFNTRDIYIEMCKATGISLTESQMSLQEVSFNNLKNFLSNIAEKISTAINNFVERITELSDRNAEFLQKNSKIILTGDTINADTKFNGYRSYDGLTAKITNMTFKLATAAEVETQAMAGKWQTPEDYIKTDLNIQGFTYKEGGDPLKTQIVNFLKGEAKTVPDEFLTKEVRSNMYGYCVNDFKALKKLVEADKESLKKFALSMDQYLATKKSGETTTAATTTTTQTATVAGGTATGNVNAAYSYEDTMAEYFHEDDGVKVEKENPGASGVKKSFNGDDEAKKEDDNSTKVIKASKSFIKVNSQKISAKMKVSVDAYKQSMKLLKWYVGEYNKVNGEKKKEQKAAKEGTNNKSISDSIK